MASNRGWTTGEVAQVAGGDLVGDPDTPIAGVAPLDRAGPGDLSFLADRRHLESFGRSRAGVVLVPTDLPRATPGPPTRIAVPDPRRALAAVLEVLEPLPKPAWGVSASARIGRGARWEGRIAVGTGATVGERCRFGLDCVIGPHALVGPEVVMGDGCLVGAHAWIGPGTMMGNAARIGPGARVGTEGFGFVGHRRVSPVARCVLGDGVELGANATIDRGAVLDTEIGADTKIDNLVHVGHHVRVGRRCFIMAQVGIAGSTVVEDDVLLGGQAGLADHVRVGRGARVGAQSGVIGRVPDGATVSGYPARNHRDVLRQAAALKRLTPLADALRRIVGDGSES